MITPPIEGQRDTHASPRARNVGRKALCTRVCAIGMAFALAASGALAAAMSPLEIEVYDALGGVIRGATIEIAGPDGLISTTTNDAGRATSMVDSAAKLSIVVKAEGFGVARRTYATGDDRPRVLRIVLDPAPLDTSVTVTATRSEHTRAGAAPGASVLHSVDLASAPGITLDDALRHTPGFSLFRRSSSRVANPTTHGVTLRGLSASGASRTLVLADGVPLNDAFGGWVSWNRVPLAAIDRVEVVRGSASDLYGPDALGGVIQLFTISTSRATARLYADAAGQGTGRGLFGGAWGLRGWQGLAAFEAGMSDGYVLVAPEDCGPIDEKAGGSYRSGLFRLGGVASGWQVQGGGEVFNEERQNGTPFQRNDTSARLGHVSLAHSAAGGYWRINAFGGTQGYDQTFSSVSGDRTTELPTQTQRVPSETYGIATDWAGGRDAIRVLVGVEQRHVRAVNQEVRFVAGRPSTEVRAGGEQDFIGGFGQVSFDPYHSVSALVGARVERWTIDSFQGDAIEDRTLFAPRASLAWRARSDLVFQGSVSRSFRAPTLNERYRGFRAGDTQTRPNALLDPEVLTAVEFGASLTRQTSTLRVTAFFNQLDDAIANVTVITTPTLITRDRQNAGSIDSSGVELEGTLRVVSHLSASLAGTFVHSAFGDDAPAGLDGNRTPQSPQSHVAAEVRWDDLPSFGIAVRFLFIGPQYEDDRNTLTLRRAAITDVMVSRSFARGWLGFVSVDNLFDQDYDVGRTPLRTIGSPRLLRAGLRVTLP